MLQKTKGIVLHTLKYNDTSIIVDMYTELSGRTSFLVPVPRSRKAAVKSVLFQPLSFIEFEADYRPNATLYRVKEAKSFYPFTSIPYDPYKSSMALFLAEFLYRAIREEAENRPLFAYLQHSVIWLDECREGFANCFTSTRPQLHSSYINPEEAGRLRQLMRMNYETMHLFGMSRAERTRCLTIMNDYYRLHLPDFPALKSLDVLKELFD